MDPNYHDGQKPAPDVPTYVQYGTPEGQPPQYYNQGAPGGVPMGMTGAPPSYAVASNFAAMPGPAAPGGHMAMAPQPQPGQPQMTPIAQSPHIMAPQGAYYAQPYGQMAPPGVYIQPYGMGAPPGQPQYAMNGAQFQPQPVYVAQGVPMTNGGGVNAIPVAMAVVAPGQRQQSPIWKDGICDICNTPQQFFWCAFFLPWLQWADNVHRARLMDKCAALITFGIAWCLFWAGFGWLGYMFWFGWLFMLILGVTYRSRIRSKYGINGTQCDDCIVHCFCIPCAIAQEGRHIWHAEGQPAI